MGDGKCKNGPDGCMFSSRGEGLIVVHSRLLDESLGNQQSLISLNTHLQQTTFIEANTGTRDQVSFCNSALYSPSMAQRHCGSLLAMVKHVGSMGETVSVIHNAAMVKKEP